MFLEKIPIMQRNKCDIHKMRNMAVLAIRCLAEYANIRMTIFEEK
jgi:hypothetical protein